MNALLARKDLRVHLIWTKGEDISTTYCHKAVRKVYIGDIQEVNCSMCRIAAQL